MQKTWILTLAAALIGGVATVNAAEDQAPAAAKPVEEIVVTGRAREFYLNRSPSLGNKFPADLRAIPQSIQILPEQLIKDQAAVEITDLYRNISSVSVFSYSGVTFRGFRQDEIRYDGLRGDPFSGFSVPLLFDIESVEIIKGPSGALFGGGQPGGVINYVTRAPRDEFSTSLSAVGGSLDLHGGRGEVSGPIDQHGRWLMRLGGAYENTDTFRFNTNKEDQVFAADLAWRPTAGTSALLRFDHIGQDFRGARLRGVPVNDAGHFLTTRRFNTNEKTDFQRLKANVLALHLAHRINADLDLTLAGRYIDSLETQHYHENRGLFRGAGGTTLARREFRDQRRDIKQYTLLGELVYRFALGPTGHTFLAGGEYYRNDNESLFFYGADSRRARALRLPRGFIVPDLNLRRPDYGRSGPLAFKPFVKIERAGRFAQWALYLQDQIQLTARLNLALGGRLEGYSERQNSTQTLLVTGQQSRDQARQSDRALTARAGIVYDLSDTVATYFNYSTGFNPQRATSQGPDSGGPFSPERGRLFELGGKVDLFDDRLYLQLAAYQINKTNVLVADPTPGAPSGRLTPIGEARSRGLELDLVGDISDNWTLTFSYGFNDTVILEGADALRNSVGDKFANAPAHQLGFWTRYDFPAIRSAIAFGGQHVSEQLSLSGQKVRPFTVFDASWITEWRNLKFQINARNLFDEVYAESGFLARTGHFPGEPRNLRLEIHADFF